GPAGGARVGRVAVGRVAAAGQPVHADAVGDLAGTDGAWARRAGVTAFAGYPLWIEGRLVGALAVFAREPLSAAAREALGLVADKIALGVGRLRAHEALRRANAELERR